MFSKLCAIGVFACWIGETRLGIGRHVQYVGAENLIAITRWEFYHSISVTVGISLVKISLGFLLLRLVRKRLYRNFLIGMIGAFFLHHPPLSFE